MQEGTVITSCNPIISPKMWDLVAEVSDFNDKKGQCVISFVYFLLLHCNNSLSESWSVSGEENLAKVLSLCHLSDQFNSETKHYFG